MWLTVYVCGWLITTMGALAAADWVNANDRPPPVTQALFGVVAGALWPMVITGLVQVAAIALIARPWRATPVRHPGRASIQLKEVIATSTH